VVTRTEIQEQLWGEETYVDFDHGVNKCVKQIRTALGDSSENPVYVETLPRHGYRFVAPVVTKTLSAPQPPAAKNATLSSASVPMMDNAFQRDNHSCKGQTNPGCRQPNHCKRSR
jgi:DNA-binding winged helix-turn-helix (wHTH) protein